MTDDEFRHFIDEMEKQPVRKPIPGIYEYPPKSLPDLPRDPVARAHVLDTHHRVY